MKHEEISELLPWYATATLEEGERLLVEEHLKGCGVCRQELAELKALEAAEVSLSESMPPLPANGLERALAEIEQYEAQRLAEVREAPAPGLLERLRAFWAARPLLAQAVMAAQLILVVGLGAMYWQSQQTIQTLGGPSVTTGGARISVQFAPTASEEQIRELLEAVQGTIADGPSALGLYTIRLAEGADEQSALERLQEAGDVVTFAQPLPE